jgi:hypothetical protein
MHRYRTVLLAHTRPGEMLIQEPRHFPFQIDVGVSPFSAVRFVRRLLFGRDAYFSPPTISVDRSRNSVLDREFAGSVASNFGDVEFSVVWT